MPLVAPDVLRSLASFRADDEPVTTCYLDVDGRRFRRRQDLESEVEGVLRTARSNANGHASVHEDLRRIEEYVRNELDRSRTRGLAIFACSARDLWTVVALPVPVRSCVTLNASPALSALEALVEEAEAVGVLIVDRQQIRVLVAELGEIKEHTETVEELPRDIDVPGQADMGTHDSHLSALAHQHLRRAADRAFAMFQSHPFTHFALVASDEVAGEIADLLHPYLRERLRGRLSVQPTAGVDELRSALLELETRLEREKEAAEVERLRGAVSSGGRGVAGLAAVLDALRERRVERLLVSQGYVESGWWCASCEALELVGRACPRCGAEMTEAADVVEEAVESALAHGCRVEICIDNADLDVMGRIGALLRY